MADEDSENSSQNLLQNLLEQIETIGDKIRKKKEHLEEVTEKYNNEASHLRGILSKLRDLEDSFNDGDKIKAEFVEFCDSIDNRCNFVTEKVERLDAILNEIRAEEEKAPLLTERVRAIDTEALSTGEGRKEFLDLKQEVDGWFDVLRQKFKEGKKRKLSLLSKGNVDDVTQSLNAWRKASEVAREYSRKLTMMKNDTESNEQSLKREIERMEVEVEAVKERNTKLDDEISLLQDKMVEAEKAILQNQTMHDEITEDLREKIKDLNKQLNDEKRANFDIEMEADEFKRKVQELESREELNHRKIEMLQERNKLLEGDVESLREQLLEGEKGKDEAEALLFEIQKELNVLDDAKEDEGTGKNASDFKRVNHLVQTLKKKLEENQGYIENLESEIKGEKARNSESVEEIEKLLRKIEIEEKGKEEQSQLIGTIRNLLDENEKLAADLESQNKTLNEDISEERERVMELRGRVGELQQTISEEKRVNFDMEMEVSKLKDNIEDEKSRNELSLKRIELLQQEITNLLDTIKEKVTIIEELRSQLSDYEDLKDKLRAERQRNEDNLQSIMELQNRIVRNEKTLEEKESEIRDIKAELKNTKEKLENVEKELEWIKENSDLLSGILQEKDRSLQEKEERLKQALVNLNSERTVQDEYSIKCEMLEKKVYLTESENKEIIKVAELAENELQKEREKNVAKDDEILNLKAQVEEERKKNIESERIINELEEQLTDADALNQYNQGIKSSSIENIMEAEKQNEQLLNIIEELKANVNEKELGIEELVMRYAIEEQKLRDEISQLKGQLGLSKMDNQTKSEIIRYLKEEIERMRNVMRIKKSVLGIEGEISNFDDDTMARQVQELEQGLEEVNMRDYDDQSRNEFVDYELEERESEVQELLEILESEKEKNVMYEEMIQRLEEMVKLTDETKNADESDGGRTEEANEIRKELYAKKEEYKDRKRKHIEDKVTRLEEAVDDLRGRLRAEQRQVKDRDNLISKLNEANNRDLARNEELTAQLQAMKEKAMQQLRHSEEMAKKVEDGQKLIRDLEVQVDKERLRATTIEAVLASEKGKSTEKKEVTKDLKRRVEEYQKTVNDIKGKVDKINRHLHCMSPGSHDAPRMSSSDASMKRINERLASHSSFIRELKASVSAVEETSKNIRAELRTQTDKGGKQDKKIEDLLGKSTEYDSLVAEMKQELGEIRKRYQELSGELAPDEDSDVADGRPESPTKLLRGMPEHELRKQMSNFEEILETLFSEEARRIEELQDKLDEVFKKNVELSSILYEIRDSLEEDRGKRVPWEVERDELKASVVKSEVKIDHLVATLEKEEMVKERLHEKIRLLEEELKDKEKLTFTLQADIREAQGTILRLEAELTDEKERNSDLQERVIKEMEDSLQDSKKKLDEIRIQADQEVQKTVTLSAAEKSEKEKRIKELETEMEKQGDLLEEFKSYLEKEQNQVFELSERLEIERNHLAMKENMIENVEDKLKRETERNDELRKLIEEAEDRTQRLSEALTKEQVRGVERVEAMKHLQDTINDEQSRLAATRDALDEEIQLTKQLKEKLSFEQLLKSEFERELDKAKTSLAEEKKAKEALLEELHRDKNSMYETENILREQEEEAKEKAKIMDELKSDLDTERKCYRILSERLQSEQNRIIELEIKLNEAESLISSDKGLLDSLRENCLKGEEKQFEVLDKLERAERLNKEKDEEINALINELAVEKIRVEELLANLESEKFSKSQMEERIKELEETTTRDELLFEELRGKIDAEAMKNREIAEQCDQERSTGQMFREKVRELEKQVAQDSEIFEELKRTIEIEREQSRKLDELLQNERNETVRRDNILTELEGQLYVERITKDEVQGQLECERKSNLDLHEQLRMSREEEFNRRDIERKLAEEMKFEVEEKIAIQAQKAQELETMLDEEMFKVLEKETARKDLQRSVEQKDLWLAKMADELTKDMEDSQSSTDEERELRDQDVTDNMGRHQVDRECQDSQEDKNPYDDLLNKILAGRNAKKNVKLKSRERKKQLAEKETLVEEINRKYTEERKQKEERLAELEEYENRMRLVEDECATYRRDSAKLQDDLDGERNRNHYFEVLLDEQQKRNQDQDDLVKSLEGKVNEGFERLHATTEQYEEQMRENRARQEENMKLRDLCAVQQDKIEQLDKDLEGIKILYQEKDNLAQETIYQINDLKKQLDEAERDILYKEELRKREKGQVDDITDGRLLRGTETKEAVGSLREEVDNVKRIMNNRLMELSTLRKQLNERGDIGDSASLKKMEERAKKAETQLKKLQSSYQLLQADVEMKTFLVDEAHNQTNNLRSALDEKRKIIMELRERDKVSKPTEVYRDDSEIQKLKLTLTQKEKEIQNLNKEYKAQLSKQVSEQRDLEVSVEIMKSVYQGLKAEKERDDAAKNAEKLRKSKEDISTAIDMVANLRQQIDSLQEEIAEQQQMSQNLKEDDKRAKLPNENEKNYLKRRSSVRGVLSMQIDEKEKKLKRLQTLLNSIENRYGKELLELRERKDKGESPDSNTPGETVTSSQEVRVEKTLPLPDLVGTTKQTALTGEKESKLEHPYTDQTNQSCYDVNVLLKENQEDTSSNALSGKKKAVLFFLVAVALGLLAFVIASKVSGTSLVYAVIAVVVLLIAYRLKRRTSKIEFREKELLNKMEEMKICREGDAKLIEELKKQLEEEIADKENKRVEMEEVLANKDAMSNYDKQRDAEEFEARMKEEIEKTKLSEAEKSKRGFEEYKVLQAKIDYMKQLRESDMKEKQAKIAELERLVVISEEKKEHGIKAVNIPISVIPICIAISVLLCKLSGYHFAASFVMFGIMAIFSANAWYSKKKVAQMLRDERQNFEDQNEEMAEITDLLDRQFEVVKSQKSAIEMLMKEIEKEKQERREKRNTLAKLIWQLQEMEGMQNIISKQAPKRKETEELEAAVRSKAEERALERAKFYNNMINTLKEINADEEDDDEMADDLCDAVQELAEYAEDQLEEKKKRELAEEKLQRPKKKKSKVSWKAAIFVAVNTAAMVASLAFRSYLVVVLIAIQAFIYGIQGRDGSVDQLKEKLRREASRNKTLQVEMEKLKKLLETEKTYKMSDEFALEIKERKKTRQSKKINH